MTDNTANDDRMPADIYRDMLHDLTAENERLQARITELEAELAVTRGTLAAPPPDDDQPDIVHDVPPNAPR